MAGGGVVDIDDGRDDERTYAGGEEDVGMRILGICGGIGSGKSTACRLMVDSLGCAARIGEHWRLPVCACVFVCVWAGGT